MPLLHMKCDSRLENVLTKPGTYWCPNCEVEVGRDETYRVGKRFFATGAGAMLAMTAALNMPGHPTSKQTKPEPTNTFMEVKRQKRKKLHSLRTKQQRQMRKKGGK